MSEVTFGDWQEEQFKDPEFIRALKELEPGYQVARLRLIRGLTQAELAARIGTQQPSIARIESGRITPSIALLRKIGEALGARLEVSLIPDS